MALLKCKMCGGDLVLPEDGVLAECEYCGSLQTVPSADNEKKLTLFSRANRLRFGCEFDKAAGVYEALVADFPEEAEAYWGLVLCKYGIEYVDDPASGKKIPTCHRSSFESVMEDSDFEQVLENADALARKVYREEAKQIEELRKGILEVSSKEDPYDIFICYKETAADGNRTLDSVLAQDVYDALTEKGYRVFFSRITLEDKLGQEYEPYIFAALNSAKVMLAFGTDYEYFNAVWVRNEWSRYLKLMEADKSKHLIPCYKGIDAYDMPKEFNKLQAQDMGKVGAIQDLLRGVDKLVAAKVASAAPAANMGANIAELLAMGSQALEAGEWNTAVNRFDLALMADPKCAEAYLGKLMAERKCKQREDLQKCKQKLEKSEYFRDAMAFAGDSLKQELDGYCSKRAAIRKKLARRYARGIGTTLGVLVIAMFIAMFTVLESRYHSATRAFYAGELSAQQAMTEFSQVWYREPDDCIKIILRAKLNNKTLYPEAVGITSVTIPDGVTKIGAYMFSHCTSLTSVTIPDSVTSIGDSAFQGCTGLISITIPNSVKEIGHCAFQSCTSLTTVIIPDSITRIGTSTFAGCARLTSITIPYGVTSIGEWAFDRCNSLTSITIPSSVTSIGRSVFYGCTGLTSITIPSSVTSIGQSAFQRCTGLASITIPGSVTLIDNFVFQDCTGLTSVMIPGSVTSIGQLAFYGCTGLTSVTIPESVTSIGQLAFSDCTGLTDVFYTGTKEQWNQIKIIFPNSTLTEAQIHYEHKG